ncbi:type II secretion system protein F [Oenococcus sicerae]|uniref:Type II secretion system protein F n=1 Tax=Oenococcus sicerae TaxID=2203724 RepID=A0ABX5QK30_9LACO|nr:type II secretion system F family protein [Oenococcus sicerae]QAS69122.1 type II secretion system protein F [Oenococcus sicerae]
MKPLKIKQFLRKPAKTINKLSRKKQVAFFSLLGQLIQSGYSINQAIQFMEHVSPDDAWLKKLNQNLSQGKDFPQAVHPYLNNSLNFQIGMANRYGKLETVLLQLADFAEKNLEQENKIKQILKYPLILVILLFLIAVAVKIFLLPILSSWSDQASNEPVDSFFWIKMVAIISSILLIVGYKYVTFRKLTQIQKITFYTKLPLFGKTISYLVNYQFSLQLSMLTSSGLQISQIARDIAENKIQSVESEFACKMVEMLEKGQNLSDFFEELAFLDPTINIYFQQGSDEKLLKRNLQVYSKIIYTKFLSSVDRLIGLVQPLSFALVGLGIVFLYLSMLMPMYQTLGGLSQ